MRSQELYGNHPVAIPYDTLTRAANLRIWLIYANSAEESRFVSHDRPIGVIDVSPSGTTVCTIRNTLPGGLEGELIFVQKTGRGYLLRSHSHPAPAGPNRGHSL